LPALTGITEGEAPKEIVLEDLNGRSVNVSNHFGKRPVIIIFWNLTENNTFLDYSVDELRILKDVYEKLHDKTGLEMFAVYVPLEFNGVTDKEISSVRNLIETNGIKFPVLIDSGYKFFKEYGVIAIPSTIMIAETGKIEFMYPSLPVSAY
jgi:peroxiredoxin